MDETTKGIHEVYDTREKYIIIGLTGRTGSGCSKAAEILNTKQEDLKITLPKILGENHNEKRKYSIVKRFIGGNWIPFEWIKIKDIITSFILEIEKDTFIEFVAKFIESDDQIIIDSIKNSFMESCGEQYDILREKRLELKKKISDTEER